MIDFNSSEISVAFQCNLLSISRSSVYYKPKQIKQRDLDLMRIIDEQFLAQDLLGAKLPDPINKKNDQKKTIENLAGKVYEGLFSNYVETMILPEKFGPFLFQIKDGFLDKIGYCMKMLFIPSKEDLRVFSLPESLSFVRYLLRPLRLITEYIKRIPLKSRL